MVQKIVANIINNQVIYELECIDRMYLNDYVPRFRTEVAAVFVSSLRTESRRGADPACGLQMLKDQAVSQGNDRL
ncbi:hypothetical protein OAM69_03155 [bacterium]|nr:hypothetical protein [bacterium]